MIKETEIPVDHAQRIIDPKTAHSSEDLISLRPSRLSEFVGQQKLKDNLAVFIEAAKNRKEALDHLLLAGPPGLGKTTLAHILAHELGVHIRSTTGPSIEKAGDLAALLTHLEPFDILFVDEIHRIPRMVEEILYPAMEDYKLDLMIGEGPSARSLRIDLVPFTLVGATTRSGLLSSPLRSRFGIPLYLDFYTDDDLAKIIVRSAQILRIGIEADAAFQIAKRSRKTPRVANRLLKRVRDFAEVSKVSTINTELALHALHQLEVDQMGLEPMDRKLLSLMIDHFGGGPVGIDSLCASLQEERDVLEDIYEPYLLQIGFLVRTPRGRLATDAAYEHLGRPRNSVNSAQRSLFHLGSDTPS